MRQLIQSEIAAFGVPTHTETPSVIVNEKIDYHTNHLLFQALLEQFDTATKEVFATGLLRNDETVRQEPRATVAKAIKGTIIDKQANPAVRRVTRRALYLGSFNRDQSQRIVEDDTYIKSFATHAKRHVDQALDDWLVTTIERKPSLIFLTVEQCCKSVKKEPLYVGRRLMCAIHALDHALKTHVVMDPTTRTLTVRH